MSIALLDNSPAGFMDLLAERLDRTLRSFWHANEYSEQHEPYMHVQALPITRAQAVERNESRDWPIVRLFHHTGIATISGQDSNSADLTIHIEFGGWNEDEENQGWRIPHAMMWAILQDLLADTRLGAYQLIDPLTWEFPDSEKPPFWGAILTTTWHLQEIIEEVGLVDADLTSTIEFEGGNNGT